MTAQLINSILPATIFVGVIISVIAIVFSTFSRVKKDTGQALRLLDRVQKLDEQTTFDLNKIESIIRKEDQEGVSLDEKVELVIREVLDDMEKSSTELISIINDLGSVVPSPLQGRIQPRTREMKRQLEVTKTKVGAIKVSLNHGS